MRSGSLGQEARSGILAWSQVSALVSSLWWCNISIAIHGLLLMKYEYLCNIINLAKVSTKRESFAHSPYPTYQQLLVKVPRITLITPGHFLRCYLQGWRERSHFTGESSAKQWYTMVHSFYCRRHHNTSSFIITRLLGRRSMVWDTHKSSTTATRLASTLTNSELLVSWTNLSMHTSNLSSKVSGYCLTLQNEVIFCG